MERNNNLPLYEVIIDDSVDGVYTMSIVDSPAVNSKFLKFNRQDDKVVYHFNEEKRIVTGVALRANYPIYRRDGDGEYYVIFEPKQIEQIAHRFMREKKLDAVNIDHSVDADNIYLIESFILKDGHGYEEFSDIDEGSWIVSYKVENEDVWQKIKSGKLNGFSVEISCILQKKEDKTKLSKISEILDLIDLI